MVFLMLSILCSVIIGLMLKQSEINRGSRLVVISVNYIVAAGINAAMWGFTGFDGLDANAIILGAVTGLQFILSFYLMMRCMGSFGVAITVTVTRIAVVMPVIVSILFYNEQPSIWQIAGLALAITTFGLLGKAKSNNEATKERHLVSWVMFAGLFLCMGLNGVNLKIFDEHFAGEQTYGFLTVLFVASGIFSWGLLVRQKAKIKRSDISMGLLLGIPNGLSSIFFIFALKAIDGVVAFPVNDVSIVLVSTVAAMVLWKERLNRYGWIALSISVIAIVLMNQ